MRFKSSKRTGEELRARQRQKVYTLIWTLMYADLFPKDSMYHSCVFAFYHTDVLTHGFIHPDEVKYGF